MKTWEKRTKLINGCETDISCPVIVSASRATDIPAFYSDWIMNRFREGFVSWKNPFNQKTSYISFEKTRVVVFWTKNAKPMLKNLKELDSMNLNYYFQFTVNDYEKEHYEPNVPALNERIDTFKELSERIGKNRVIWRFDPLFLTKDLNEEILKDKIERVAEKLKNHTTKLVFSYADINVYRKVMLNLKREQIPYLEFSHDRKLKMAEMIAEIAKKYKLIAATCSEDIDLKKYGIEKNRCIDDRLMIQEFKNDTELMEFLGYREDTLFGDDSEKNSLKDKGQRKECGCIISKDIGEYNTCGHLCVYCYANYSKDVVEKNLKKHKKEAETIVSE